MSTIKHKLSVYQPAPYQIKVSGHVDDSWPDWAGEISVVVGSDDCGLPITTLTGSLDQAALLGLLRRLFSLRLPLISAIYQEVI